MYAGAHKHTPVIGLGLRSSLQLTCPLRVPAGQLIGLRVANQMRDIVWTRMHNARQHVRCLLIDLMASSSQARTHRTYALCLLIMSMTKTSPLKILLVDCQVGDLDKVYMDSTHTMALGTQMNENGGGNDTADGSALRRERVTRPCGINSYQERYRKYLLQVKSSQVKLTTIAWRSIIAEACGMTWGDVSPFLSLFNSLYLSPSLSHHITQLAIIATYNFLADRIHCSEEHTKKTSCTPSNCILLHTPEWVNGVDRHQSRLRHLEQVQHCFCAPFHTRHVNSSPDLVVMTWHF
ncbi:hypothetical protein EGR_03056 [Echinococcus granulosus]|uniref:Uncharacterized protein n=1 Tax=Echinococcus granulosus TaxID=6210 RepID=W6UKI0_ECHGR|nr:hypothetical protein EGR_03056 [Echinococcus granulosus]EUB62035.1 hypothetical protein EGR_03056 [Echinococcus granulosus]